MATQNKQSDFKPVPVRGMFWRIFIEPFLYIYATIIAGTIISAIYAILDGNTLPKNGLYNALSTDAGKFLVIFSFYLSGYLLFVFKKNQQYWYGIFESTFALVSSYFLIGTIQSVFTQREASPYIWLTIISTVYLIVRGFSNVDEGRKKPYFLKSKIGAKVYHKDPITGEDILDHWD